MNVLGEMQLNPFDDNGAPFLNLRLGYHHLWNQYPNGKGSLLADFGSGIQFIVTPEVNIYVKYGIVFSHNTLFLPFALGCQF